MPSVADERKKCGLKAQRLASEYNFIFSYDFFNDLTALVKKRDKISGSERYSF